MPTFVPKERSGLICKLALNISQMVKITQKNMHIVFLHSILYCLVLFIYITLLKTTKVDQSVLHKSKKNNFTFESTSCNYCYTELFLMNNFVRKNNQIFFTLLYSHSDLFIFSLMQNHRALCLRD